MDMTVTGVFLGNPMVDLTAAVDQTFLSKHSLKCGEECPPITEDQRRVLWDEVCYVSWKSNNRF